MYTLLHGFYKYIIQKDEYCVLILGLDNAGKTVGNARKSPNVIVVGTRKLLFLFLLQTYLEATKTKFTKKYKAMNPNRITTTVGLNIGKIDVNGVRLNFWDLGGQQELQSLWDKVIIKSFAKYSPYLSNISMNPFKPGCLSLIICLRNIKKYLEL